MELNTAPTKDIQSIIDERRRNAQESQLARIKEIEKAIPEYKEFSEAIADLSIKRVSAAISGNEESSNRMLAEMKAFAEQKKALLVEHGFEKDYDEPRYTCKLCQDTGTANSAKCSCYKQLKAASLYENSGIKDALKVENFTTFNIGYFDKIKVDALTKKTAYENMTANLSIAREAASKIGKTAQNLLFYGASGTGKTFLSNCIAEEVLKNGYLVVYQPATSFFDKMAKGRFGENPEDRNQILSCDLLVIDDLGTEFNNALISSVLFETINERILTKKSTIISTNLDLNQIRDSYSERISSRILENYRICKFFNPDIRLIKRRENLER